MPVKLADIGSSPAIVGKFLAALKRLKPTGAGITKEQLCKRARVRPGDYSFRNLTHPELAPYRVKLGFVVYWGHPKDIARAKNGR